MCLFLIINCIKSLIPKIQTRLSTFTKLNWKVKLFLALQLLIFIALVHSIINLGGEMTRDNPKYNSDPHPLSRDPNFEKVIGNLAGGLSELSHKEIIILHWTSFWGNYYPTILNSENCSIFKTGTIQQPPISGPLFDKPCRITHDHRYMDGSHAVVFHSPDIYYSYPNLPKGLRTQNQIWIWYQMEAPLQTVLNLTKYRNRFNWTMTYRRDSDVYYPYGYIIPRNISTNHDHHHRKSLKMKSSLAAWIVSSCDTPSKREDFVKELQNYIPVDIFGTCGKKPCPQLQDKGYSNCYDYIQSKYKFYFAFENSLCLDYITEKFFLALNSDMVPVVYGGGIDDDRMDYLAVAPEHSFIDARKFRSPKELANYLIYLDKNEDEYLKYFEWKGKYQVITKDYGLGWCNLCQKVYQQIYQKREEHLWNKVYSDLYIWWNYKDEMNSSNVKFPQIKPQSKLAVGSIVMQSFQYDLRKVKPTCGGTKDNFTFYGQ